MGNLCMSSFSFLSNFTFLNCLILVLGLLFGSLGADFLNPFKDVVGCNLISCGQGTCKSSDNSTLGFDCECNPGWKKIQIGSLSFPSCVVPNCSVDFECGSKTTTPPPPPPPASLFPSLNFSDPCALTWCGDGTCIANGTGHICSCHEGSSNLMNKTSLTCFKQCSLGADCTSLGINVPPPGPSSPFAALNGMPTPSPSSSDSTVSTSPVISVSTGNGASEKPNWWRIQLALTTSLIIAIFVYWV